MNSDKRSSPEKRKKSGNALVYVLLALALLGALTMLLSEQGGHDEDLGYERTKLSTARVTATAASAKQVVDQMMMSGTTFVNLDYTKPGETGFDDTPYIHKIYHPDGGGLNYSPPAVPPFDGETDVYGNGWYFATVDVEWTPSSTEDLVLTAYMIDEQICKQLNRDITGDETIPVLTTGSLVEIFLPFPLWSGVANTPLTKIVCPECEGYPALCVSDGGGTPKYGYYNIIAAR